MKKKLFFLPFLAALAFAGCSNDDDPAAGGNENKGDDYGYVAVNIVQPKSIGTRAAGTGFEYGTDDENKAESGLFFIFNTDGTIYTMDNNPQSIALTTDKSGDDANNSVTPQVEKIYNAVLVIDGAETAPTAGLQIVCVLNAPASLATSSVSSLSDLKAKIADYSAHTSGTFIMSNSVYKDGDKEILGATVATENISKSASVALNNPVDIYVERVVAKIRAKGISSFNNQGANPAIDGVEKNLTIKLTGIEIANIAQTSYLVKNIDGITYDWAWDATNKRSYWETVPASLTYGNKSYNTIVSDSPKDGENGTFDITKVNTTDYIQPNTSAQKTAVLVTAELLDGTTPCDFVYLRGGYFTPDKALALIAQYAANNGYYKKTSAEGVTPVTYSQLATSDFEWKNNNDLMEEDAAANDGTVSTISWLKRYEVVARVKSNVSNLYKKNGDTYIPATAAQINTLLAGTESSHPYVAQYYKDGKCYYFVNIDQTSVANERKAQDAIDADAHTYDGVVRNHIYDLTLSSIKGVGTAVFDPTDVIIPERPDVENLYYLAAQIDVLAWKVVTQTVNFE